MSALSVAGLDVAAAHLQRRGFDILARQAAIRLGSIDLVDATARGTSWATARVGACASGATAWLAASTTRRGSQVRLDAVGVVLDSRGRLVHLDHLPDAF